MIRVFGDARIHQKKQNRQTRPLAIAGFRGPFWAFGESSHIVKVYEKFTPTKRVYEQ